MKMIRWSTLVFLLLLFCQFTSCTEAVETIPLDEWQTYGIVRPDEAGDGTVEAAALIRRTVQEQLNVKLPLITDWVGRGESVPEGTPEILIGRTNRPESGGTMKYRDWSVSFVNGRLVITGGSDDAVLEAAKWYAGHCIGNELRLPAQPYVHAEVYPLEHVSVNGIPLTAINIHPMDREKDYAVMLADYLAGQTGRRPDYTEENALRFAFDPELAVDELRMTKKGKVIWIETSDIGYSAMQALEILVEKIEMRKNETINFDERIVVPMENFRSASAEQLKEWEQIARHRRTEIRSTPNMEIPEGAVVYYLSESGNDENDGKTPGTAWKTVAHLDAQKLPKGSYVCFERGGEFRGKIRAQAGVTYTAYGQGNKPVLNGSPYDGVRDGKWTEAAENVWVYSETFDKDVGGIVFNEGEAFGIKALVNYAKEVPFDQETGEPFYGAKTLSTQGQELRFWHDHEGPGVNPSKPTSLYLYCSAGNPAEIYDRIEFMTHEHIINVARRSDITVNNLCIRYGGAHGIGAETCRNLIVTDCEVGFIGGSCHKIDENGYHTRYGNAIEIYGGCENFVIDRCYVYECYDAGITHQYSAVGDEDIIMDGVTYTRNLIENCIYNIEYFLGRPKSGNPVRYMKDIVMRDNILLNAGYGWGEQRPDKNPDAHIKGWDHMNTLESNFVIENNLFLFSKQMMVHIGVDKAEDLPEVKNNIFVQHAGGKFGRFAENRTEMMMYTYETISSEGLADNIYYVANTGDRITLD